jgi:cell division protease FtsH
VTRYGMSERLGSVAYDRDPRSFLTGPDLPPPPRERDYAEETAAAIDRETLALVDAAMERASDVLRQKRDVLERGAGRLLEKETLDEKELTELAGPPVGRSVRIAAE